MLAPLAQLAEHLTFNQVVRGSNPPRGILCKWRKGAAMSASPATSTYVCVSEWFMVLPR